VGFYPMALTTIKREKADPGSWWILVDPDGSYDPPGSAFPPLQFASRSVKNLQNGFIKYFGDMFKDIA